jgi:uncharacterized protein YozE (UPF0346 family)
MVAGIRHAESLAENVFKSGSFPKRLNPLQAISGALSFM